MRNTTLKTVRAAAILAASGTLCVSHADILAHYRADGNCLDSVGAHHGTPQNGAGFATGIAGQAFELNGANQYINAPDSPAWHFGDNPFTVSVWVNFDTIQQNIVQLLPNVFVGQDDGSGTQDKWVFFADSNGQPWFHINGPGYAFITPPFGPKMTTGSWHHYVVTRSGSTYTFYVDAVLYGTAEHELTIPDSFLGLTIGQAEGLGFLDGRIDDIQIYDYALSHNEVNYLFLFPGSMSHGDGCPSDLNEDLIVDGADLGVLLGDWDCSSCSADLNDDGDVDGADLGILLGDWGPCMPM